MVGLGSVPAGIQVICLFFLPESRSSHANCGRSLPATDLFPIQRAFCYSEGTMKESAK